MKGDLCLCNGDASQIQCMTCDSRMTNFLLDAFLSDLLLSRWPTFISLKVWETIHIFDLIKVKESAWRSDGRLRCLGLT